MNDLVNLLDLDADALMRIEPRDVQTAIDQILTSMNLNTRVR